MRFIITIITSLILLIPASGQGPFGGQGQWEIVDLGTDFFPIYPFMTLDYLLDVQFLDQDIGYIGAGFWSIHDVGVALYKTKDGGKSWNLIFKDLTQSISSFHFINESKGYSASIKYIGSSNYLYTTSDSGYSWTRFSREWDIGSGADFFFLNDSIGWIYEHNRVYKTLNGGEHWNEEYETPEHHVINSLFFVDESTGWGVDDEGLIYKFSEKSLFDISRLTYLPLKKIFFVDQGYGWISGGYSNSDGLGPLLLKTSDGGESWVEITEIKYLLNDFYFVNKDQGWAVGSNKTERGFILETFNGGLDWQVVAVSPARLNALYISDGIGWAVGDDGLILKCDSVATWIKEDNTIIGNNEPVLQNYPNPFSSNTTITYQLPATSNVELSVYDISGRKVATLINELQQPDRYEVEWNAEGMESGIYFCELKTGQGRKVMKMILTH